MQIEKKMKSWIQFFQLPNLAIFLDLNYTLSKVYLVGKFSNLFPIWQKIFYFYPISNLWTDPPPKKAPQKTTMERKR